MAEAAAGGANGGQDPSMEEILQSIRAIIAEDGDEKKPAAETPKPNNPNGEVSGSDVLELTEMVADDGSTVSLKENGPAPVPVPAQPAMETPPPAAAEPPPPPPPSEPSTPANAPADVLNVIEEALTPAAAAPAAVPAEPTSPASAESPAAPAPSGDALLSDQAAGAATAAIKKLQTATEPPIPAAKTSPSPTFESGNSVEAMARAMLRPMIKDWLDKNLPAMVERIVTMEIRRLSK